MNSAPKILIIRLSSLGDIILAMPLIRNLKVKWPGAHVAFLAKKAYAGMLRANSLIDEVIEYRGLIETAGEINRKKFDYLLNIHSTPRTAAISLLSGAKKKVRYKKDSLARRLFVNFRVPSCSLEKRVLDRYLEILGHIGVPAVFREPSPDDWKISRVDYFQTGAPGICVVQTAFLGDCALTLPLAGEIKNKWPKSRLCVVAIEQTKDVFLSSKHVDEVIIDRKRESDFLSGFFRLAGEIKKRKFDAAIVPHRSLRSALLVFFARIPQRIGFSNSAGRLFFTRTVPFSWLLHDSERNLTLLSPLLENFRRRSQSPSFRASGKLFDLRQTSMIAINPGSVWATKRWPAERYIETGRKIFRAVSKKVIILGGPEEEKYNARIENGIGKEKCLNLTGKTKIKDLISVISGLKLLVTNDSGPMHIAAGFNVPLISIFGPTTRELGFFPRGKNSAVVEEDLACRPCALHGSRKCPRGHFLCMKLVTAGRVWEEILKTGTI